LSLQVAPSTTGDSVSDLRERFADKRISANFEVST